MLLIPNSAGFGEPGLFEDPPPSRPVRECDASGECASCRKKRLKKMREKKGGEIHSAKAHRCVDKVQAKGHDESSAWAICNTSVGKSGMYAKGHGGNASPKRKVKESNDCHNPGGPGGGQFCSGSGSEGKGHQPQASKGFALSDKQKAENYAIMHGSRRLARFAHEPGSGSQARDMEGVTSGSQRHLDKLQQRIDRTRASIDRASGGGSQSARSAYPGRTISGVSQVAQSIVGKQDRAKAMDKVPEEIHQAGADWESGRAYVDNAGNFRLKATRKVAPWNKSVKRLWKTNTSQKLHNFALRKHDPQFARQASRSSTSRHT